MEYVRLEKLVELKQGLAINSHTNYLVSDHETKLALLRIADMPSKRKVVFMDEDTPDRYIADEDDIIYTRTGQVGLVFTGQNGVVHNNCFRVIPIDEQTLSRKYLFWALSLPEVYYMANIYAAGAAQPDLPHSSFKKIKIPICSLNNQKRIVSILSAYDNLIENNNKRIRLLEQMAENLYKEWFVRFRFPGHEKAEFENGLPKGWAKSPLSEICEFKRGKNITSDEMCVGNIPVISAGIDVSGYHSKANVKGVYITMSSSGANAGYISLHYTDIWAADCSYIDESTTPNIFYVYELLNNLRAVITNFQRGAAQPHVYPKDINRIKLVVPNNELMVEANKKLAVIHKEIHHLQQQSNLLSRQRDLLLPRLMSGKLEVNV